MFIFLHHRGQRQKYWTGKRKGGIEKYCSNHKIGICDQDFFLTFFHCIIKYFFPLRILLHLIFTQVGEQLLLTPSTFTQGECCRGCSCWKMRKEEEFMLIHEGGRQNSLELWCLWAHSCILAALLRWSLLTPSLWHSLTEWSSKANTFTFLLLITNLWALFISEFSFIV